jgi:hypothetical protein
MACHHWISIGACACAGEAMPIANVAASAAEIRDLRSIVFSRVERLLSFLAMTSLLR